VAAFDMTTLPSIARGVGPGSSAASRIGDRRSWLRYPLAALLFALAPACTPVQYLPPSPAVRAEIDRVAVAATDEASRVAPAAPVRGSGSGAAAGFGQGVATSIGEGCRGSGSGCALGLLLAPVFGFFGAIYGAAAAHSGAEVDVAEAGYHSAMAEIELTERLADKIVEIGGNRGGRDFHRAAAADAGDPAWGQGRGDADTILEATVTDLTLLADGSIDPDVSLVMGVRGRLVRAGDKAELYRRSWAYISEAHDYLEFAAADARLLKREVDRAVDRFAATIVDDLFVANAPADAASPERGRVITVAGPTVAAAQQVAARPSPGAAAGAVADTGSTSSAEPIDNWGGGTPYNCIDATGQVGLSPACRQYLAAWEAAQAAGRPAPAPGNESAAGPVVAAEQSPPSDPEPPVRSCTDPAYAGLPECRDWLVAWNAARAAGRPPPPPTEPLRAPAAAGIAPAGHGVILGRYRDRAAAARAWDRRVARFPLLGAAASRTVAAPAAGDGAAFVLQGTGLTARQADAICAAMRRARTDCAVIRLSPPGPM
jgi:hypothetical protein